MKMKSQFLTLSFVWAAFLGLSQIRLYSQQLGDTHSERVPMPTVAPVNIGAAFSESLDGLIVNSVEPNSAAAKAGLRTGDFVKKVDGQGILTLDGLFRVFHRHAAGSRVSLVVVRQNAEQPITVILPGTF